ADFLSVRHRRLEAARGPGLMSWLNCLRMDNLSARLDRCDQAAQPYIAILRGLTGPPITPKTRVPGGFQGSPGVSRPVAGLALTRICLSAPARPEQRRARPHQQQ